MDDATRQVLGILRAQRAQRHFTSEAVPEDALDEILRVARWTGSARNRQPWCFAAVTAGGARRRLSELGHYAQHLAHAPVVIAALADPTAGGTDTEFDMGRACQNIALAASAQGLGSCPATLHPAEHAQTAAAVLGLDPPWECRHAISLGFPARTPTGRSAIPAGRQPAENTVLYIRD